jgi:predicted nucleotidyltransferase
VKRCYERSLQLSATFQEVLARSTIELPAESCICLNGSTSRLESVPDSDIDYVLVWNDLSPNLSTEQEYEKRRREVRIAVDKINSILAENSVRPCDSFSCAKGLSELISTENLFSRYSILTLVDSSLVAGDEASYETFLERMEINLADYAIGISAEKEVIRALVWYIQREGWIDQLQRGTSVNRFSRLIQLFVAILFINYFGLKATRETKTTWLRIVKLQPFVQASNIECLKKLWIRALELKENRARHPMLRDTGFIAVSELMEMWKDILELSLSD